MKNPFNVSKSVGSQIWTISAMTALLGFMTSIAFRTNRARADFKDPDQNVRVASSDTRTQEELIKLRGEVTNLRSENGKLQSAMSGKKDTTKVLSETLETLKLYSGLTEVSGPGIKVVLSDGDKAIDAPTGDKTIHDIDVLKVVNELWNAGAEGIAVDGNRVVIGSNFRCVGTTILVDSVKVSSPIEIRAIGKAKDLSGALKMPEGIFDEITRTDPKMIRVEMVEKLTLPAFSGSTARKYLNPAGDTK